MSTEYSTAFYASVNTVLHYKEIRQCTDCTTDDVATSQIFAVLSPDTVKICRLSGLTQTCSNITLSAIDAIQQRSTRDMYQLQKINKSNILRQYTKHTDSSANNDMRLLYTDLLWCQYNFTIPRMV